MGKRLECINSFFWVPHRVRDDIKKKDVVILHGMFSLKNKKQNRVVFALALFLFSSGIFFLLPGTVHANAWGAVKEVVGGAIGGVLDSTVGLALRGLLYAVFVILGWFTSVAVTLFEWCIKPEYISGNGGLLNKQSVYANWKFIRDFFNLFFILTLLYTAFTIVFQVAKNYKQTLLSIILAAMFVNFSFPITRVIIDVTNVPMYYFVNQMMAKEEGKSAFGNFLGASKIQDALIPGYSVATGSTTQLLMAIVMLFMFMIALLVFSVLMVVRLVAIVMLLIFSSVGFAASVIPGMQEYGDKWWKALWQYSLFGPTSMLMMLIATRFFEEIGKDGTRGQFMQVAISNATPAESGMIASVAMFSIPIIMMWFAIGMGLSSSIVGAGAVVGLGYAAIKGAGRMTYKNAPMRGLYGGLKKGAYEGKIFGRSYASDTGLRSLLKGKTWKQASENTEAKFKGAVYGGNQGKQTELDKLHSKRVNEAVKDNKENQVNASMLRQSLTSNDVVTRQAAAISLAESGEIRTSDDLMKAIQALRSGGSADAPEFNEYASDMVTRAIDKARDGATAGVSPELYHSIAQGKESTLEVLDSKLKKDGNLHIKVNYKIDETEKVMIEENNKLPMGDRKSKEDISKMARQQVYKDIVRPLSVDDLIKQKTLHTSPDFEEYFSEELKGNKRYVQAILEKAHEKGKPEVQAVWSRIHARAVKEEIKSADKEEEDDEEAKKRAAAKYASDKIKAKRRETEARRRG